MAFATTLWTSAPAAPQRRRSRRSRARARACAPVCPVTPGINQSPMPAAYREEYIRAATDAVAAACEDRKGPRMVATLLVPDLDPRLDTYDRRFLLRWVWALIARFALDEEKRVKIVVQNPTKFGGLPISVAGLRRNIEGDRLLSLEEWGEQVMEDRVRTADIGPDAVQDSDDVFLVISATNTTGAPVVQDVVDMFEAVQTQSDRYRPFIMINPRLDDVPSHSNIMGVQGRAARLQFLHDFFHPYHLRLLYRAGTWYPVKGAIARQYPQPFQIWKRVPDLDEYALVAEVESDSPPGSRDVNEAFEKARFTEKREAATTAEQNENVRLAVAALAGMAVAGTAALLQNANLIHHFISTQ